MGHFSLIGGTSYEITGGRTLIGGTGYDIAKGRTLVGGTGYDINFLKGIPISEVPVRNSVFMNVGGVLTEFLVVHHGLPSSIYDASCNGTWLLEKNIHALKHWNSNSDNRYSNSNAKTYLNGEYLSLLDSSVQNIVKTVKIPYVNNYGSRGSVASGASGFSTKVFLLSIKEVASTNSDHHSDGACLDYFSGMHGLFQDSGRIAYLNDYAYTWWTRTPSKADTKSVMTIDTAGNFNIATTGVAANQLGMRPAMIVPFETLVDKNYCILA